MEDLDKPTHSAYHSYFDDNGFSGHRGPAQTKLSATKWGMLTREEQRFHLSNAARAAGKSEQWIRDNMDDIMRYANPGVPTKRSNMDTRVMGELGDIQRDIDRNVDVSKKDRRRLANYTSKSTNNFGKTVITVGSLAGLVTMTADPLQAANPDNWNGLRGYIGSRTGALVALDRGAVNVDDFVRAGNVTAAGQDLRALHGAIGGSINAYGNGGNSSDWLNGIEQDFRSAVAIRTRANRNSFAQYHMPQLQEVIADQSIEQTYRDEASNLWQTLRGWLVEEQP